MPSAARVGDQVLHSQALPQAKRGFWGGLLKGALIGAAIVAVAAVAVVVTVGTGGLGAPFVIGAALVVTGSALRYGAVGFSEGAQAGAQQGVRAGPITTGSGNVFVNGKAAALACLSLVACTQHGPKSKVAQGSQTVAINGKMAARVGDKGTCSFVIGEGSENVFIGAPPGTCAAISGEIPDWMWTGVKVAYWTGTVMEVAGGLMMGGLPGLKALATPLGASVLGVSMLAGHAASEWAKANGYSLSDQMMFGDLTGALVGTGLAVGGPSAMRGLQNMADALPRFEPGLEPAFAGGPRPGGFEPELVPRDPNGPGMDAWNPPRNEPLQMTSEEGGTGSGSTEPPNEANFRQRIDAAEARGDTAEADNARYERYTQEKADEGKEPLSREEWQNSTDRLRENAARGRADEDATLQNAGVENNNYTQDSAGQPRDITRYTSTEGVETRPDGVTDTHWVDVKSTTEPVVYDTAQIRAEREGALSVGKEQAVVISNDNVNITRPSGPLADQSTVLHRNSSTGEWSQWNTRANNGSGGWEPITSQQAASALGGSSPP